METTTPSIEADYENLIALKNATGAKILVGGPHATYFHQDVLKECGVIDVVEYGTTSWPGFSDMDFIVVVEPGQRSIQTAFTVRDLAGELGIKKIYAIANKVRNDEDLNFIKKHLGDVKLLGRLGFNHNIMEADIKGDPSSRLSDEVIEEARKIRNNIEALG